MIMDRALGVLSMLLVAIAALAYAHEMIAMPGVLPTVVLVAAGCLVGAAAIYSERVAALAVRHDVATGSWAKALGAGLVDAVRRARAPPRTDPRVALVHPRPGPARDAGVLPGPRPGCLGTGVGVFRVHSADRDHHAGADHPSGLGTSQLALDLFFQQVGVPSPQAVALSILFVALALVGNLPGALLYMTGSVKPSEARQL